LFARVDTPMPPATDLPADTTTTGRRPVDETAVKPDAGPPSPRPAPRSSAADGGGGSSSSQRRSLRHSAQARITAQRLREAYAAGAPF
ncbi:serine/threonine protein kinase, partial [Streptomyces ipomoeae]|nr:serine/threonine protein kinase [Streptomyces ipomoeae]